MEKAYHRELVTKFKAVLEGPDADLIRFVDLLYHRDEVSKIKIFRDFQFPGRFRIGLGAHSHEIGFHFNAFAAMSRRKCAPSKWIFSTAA